MAVVALSTIKNWFKTNLIPTQSQFWDVFDSYFHKSEGIPAASVNGLDTLLQSKADEANFQALVLKSKILAPGELWVKKANGNTNNSILEAGDLCEGVVEGYDIRGVYKGGSITLLESFIIITQDEIPTIGT